MLSCEEYFRGKKVTLMGLGLLGRGLGDAIFLAEQGAEIIVTDLKSSVDLGPSLKKLRKFKNIRYTLDGHKLEDFRNRDFILKAAGVPLDSLYITEARKQGIPIEMDTSLFAKLAPKGVTIVGVTGTRGKSTTTALIYEILNSYFSSPPRLRREMKGVVGSSSVYKGGNLVPEATLPLLKKVQSGDIVVLELDSWQLQGFHDAKISPQVAVFTTFLDDHLVYYKGDKEKYFEDKAAIFKYQKPGNTLIVGEKVAKLVSLRFNLNRGKGRTLIAHSADVPSHWKPQILGEHNRENIAAARAAAKALGISDAVIKKAVESFKGIPGRLEYLRTVRGVKIYNDNNATTPDATIAALKTLGRICRSLAPTAAVGARLLQNTRRIILIVGGTDKVLGKHGALVDEISKSCKAAILLKETGTDKLKPKLEDLRSNTLQIKEADGLKTCVEEAMEIAKKGDIVLFSPAFASFGRWFKNEYDRGEQFVRLVERLT